MYGTKRAYARKPNQGKYYAKRRFRPGLRAFGGAKGAPMYKAMPSSRSGVLNRYSSHKAINPKTKTLDLDFNGYPANGIFVVDQSANSGIPISNGQNSATPTYAPMLQNILTIQQGAAESQRIGNKIATKSIRLRLICTPTGNSNISSTHGRFMVIYDRQTNGTYPPLNTILSSLNQAGTTLSGTFMDSINPNYLERFVVLCDEFITFPAAASGTITETEEIVSTGDKPLYIDKYIKCKNLETQYNGNTVPLGIGSVTTGAIYILSWGDANPYTGFINDPWMWTGNARIRFHDC